MQRRYPGRQTERRGSPNWQERNEHAFWGRGERDTPNYDESLLPDDEYESAYRGAGQYAGPEEWASDWGDWADRAPLEPDWRGQGARRSAGGGRPQTGYGASRGYGERGYGERGRREDERGYYGEGAGARGYFRSGSYGGYGGVPESAGEQRRYGGGRSPGDAPDPSRLRGSGGARDEFRHRQGPKGYTRTDERIREDVCERLTGAFDIDVSDVSVQVRDGRVELDGTVPERWMKHGIEDIADSCMCVRDVENRVRISRQEQEGGAQVLRQDQRTVTPTPQSVREEAGKPGHEPRH